MTKPKMPYEILGLKGADVDKPNKLFEL